MRSVAGEGERGRRRGGEEERRGGAWRGARGKRRRRKNRRRAQVDKASQISQRHPRLSRWAASSSGTARKIFRFGLQPTTHAWRRNNSLPTTTQRSCRQQAAREEVGTEVSRRLDEPHAPAAATASCCCRATLPFPLETALAAATSPRLDRCRDDDHTASLVSSSLLSRVAIYLPIHPDRSRYALLLLLQEQPCVRST